jgi:hypothetical protein
MNRVTDPDSGLRSGFRLYGEIQTRTQTLVSDEQKWENFIFFRINTVIKLYFFLHH